MQTQFFKKPLLNIFAVLVSMHAHQVLADGIRITVGGGTPPLTPVDVADNISVPSDLAVAGTTTTHGINNTGNISTDTLAVTGTTTTNGLNNTGDITTTGALAVAGTTTTNGLNNTGALTNTGLLNVTAGTGKASVANDAVSVGVVNAGQKMNGITADSDHVELRGGTNFTTLTLTDAGAVFAQTGQSTARVTGIANGTDTYDAVNYGQLQNLRGQMDSAKELLAGGIASAVAMANIPQVATNKTFAVGMGVGNFNGETAFSMGGSFRINDSAIVKASVGKAGKDSETVGAGVGLSW